MNTKKNNIYIFIFSICLIYALLIISFYIACFFDKNLLYNLIVKYNTRSELPFSISDSDLKLIATELIEYLTGKLSFLETKVNISGVLTDFYSIRSKIHMGDVRHILKITLYSCYIAIFISIFTLWKVSTASNNLLNDLYKAYKKVLIVFGIVFITIIIFATFNFDAFFIAFHKLIFNNDLWLLDPNEDYIICLLPEKIFMIYGIRIAIVSIVVCLLPLFCFQLLSKIQLRQEAK